MTIIDPELFFRNTNPNKALFLGESVNDKKFYTDFSEVRSGEVIDEIKKTINKLAPNESTCQLFTGHIGCGKSTELLKLKKELEICNFHVVYFDSYKYLEMSDVDVSDILLAIISRVCESLENIGINTEANYFQRLFTELKEILTMPIELNHLNLSLGIAKLTAQTQASPSTRLQVRDYLEPRISRIIDEVNLNVLKPSISQLRNKGRKGLVVIVDNLEKIDNVPKSWDRPQHEYLFIDRGLQLKSLNCHLVYTMPISLRFSKDYISLIQRFQLPKILPMVRVKYRNNLDYKEGVNKLLEMILARAKNGEMETSSIQILDIFDNLETAEYVCKISGGHIRNLLRIINSSIPKEMDMPISRKTIKEVIQEYRWERMLAISKQEHQLLEKVSREKTILAGIGYEQLIQSMYVYEYRDEKGSWFDINPILIDGDNFL